MHSVVLAIGINVFLGLFIELFVYVGSTEWCFSLYSIVVSINVD